MTVREVQKDWISSLTPNWGGREAENITRIVLQEILNWEPYEVTLNQNQIISQEHLIQLEKAKEQLMNQIPLQQVLGKASFYEIDFFVNEHVLIPRPETEELVDWILAENDDSRKTVLDVGVGSGCIALSLKKNRPQWIIEGVDASSAAIQVTEKNAQLLEVQLNRLHLQDFLDQEVENNFGTYEIIVSNPPYIPFKESAEMDVSVLEKEPGQALFVPDDQPLLFYEAILAFVEKHLVEKGQIYFEIHEDFGTEILALCQKFNFKSMLKKDMQGKDRMVKAVKK